jgi:hypothetical protein
MLFAAAGQCACMAILAGTVSNGGHAAGLVATVMLFLFNFFFGVGLLAIPWLRMSSLTLYKWFTVLTISSACGILPIGCPYPVSGISYGNQLYGPSSNFECIILTCSGIFTFLVVEITPVSISNIGYRTYIYFAGMHTQGCYRESSANVNSIQFLFHSSDLLLLPRNTQSHSGTNRPSVHRREGATTLAPVDGNSRRCRSACGREGSGKCWCTTCRVDCLLAYLPWFSFFCFLSWISMCCVCTCLCLY